MAGNESSSISCVKFEPEEVDTDTFGPCFYTKTVSGLGLETLAPAAPAAVPVTTGPAEPRAAATLATLQAAPVTQVMGAPAAPAAVPVTTGPAEPRAAATLATLQAAPVTQVMGAPAAPAAVPVTTGPAEPRAAATLATLQAAPVTQVMGAPAAPAAVPVTTGPAEPRAAATLGTLQAAPVTQVMGAPAAPAAVPVTTGPAEPRAAATLATLQAAPVTQVMGAPAAPAAVPVTTGPAEPRAAATLATLQAAPVTQVLGAPAAPAAVPVTTGPAEPRAAATLATLQAAPVTQVMGAPAAPAAVPVTTGPAEPRAAATLATLQAAPVTQVMGAPAAPAAVPVTTGPVEPRAAATLGTLQAAPVTQVMGAPAAPATVPVTTGPVEPRAAATLATLQAALVTQVMGAPAAPAAVPVTTGPAEPRAAATLPTLQAAPVTQVMGAPAAPAAVPVTTGPVEPRAAATLATLHAAPVTQTCFLLERHRSLAPQNDEDDEYARYTIKQEPSDEQPEPGCCSADTPASPASPRTGNKSPKVWTSQDMEKALQALRSQSMSLTKASATYGIPSTTLWQRAHRLGIDTPKKEGNAKSWGSAELRRALHALRSGVLSANKASKAYGIPSSTLYKIARREGIRLAAPFNAAPTTWQRSELNQALDAIRCGAVSVQRAAAQYGIPTGTLYGRCKREGIELTRSNPTPWSERAMGEALEAVRVGQFSINQAAIHYSLPYSSLYGRFKRIKQVNQPQDYAEPQPLETVGPNLTINHTHTHHEITFLNQSVQNVHHSPLIIDIHPQVDQDLIPPTPNPNLGQGSQRIEQGLNSPNPHLISENLSLTTPQGLKLVDQANSSNNNPLTSLSYPLLNHELQSEIHEKVLVAASKIDQSFRPPQEIDDLQKTVIQQQPIPEINQSLSSTGKCIAQGLSLNSTTSLQPQQSLQPHQGSQTDQGLQALNPFVFTQYSEQCPSDFSLYYQSCNGLAS